MSCTGYELLEHPMLLDLHGIWIRTARGRHAPQKDDFSVRTLAPFLRHTAFIHRIEDAARCYRVRFFGSSLVDTVGDLTGRSFDEVLPPVTLEGWSALCDLVLDIPVPIRAVTTSVMGTFDHMRAEACSAPLISQGRHVVMIACVFGPR